MRVGGRRQVGLASFSKEFFFDRIYLPGLARIFSISLSTAAFDGPDFLLVFNSYWLRLNREAGVKLNHKRA